MAPQPQDATGREKLGACVPRDQDATATAPQPRHEGLNVVFSLVCGLASQPGLFSLTIIESENIFRLLWLWWCLWFRSSGATPRDQKPQAKAHELKRAHFNEMSKYPSHLSDELLKRFTGRLNPAPVVVRHYTRAHTSRAVIKEGLLRNSQETILRLDTRYSRKIFLCQGKV